MSWWRPCMPMANVAEQRARALGDGCWLTKSGRKLSPAVINGCAIGRWFAGKAWCGNLDACRDYEYRLPRGRSYAPSAAVPEVSIAGSVWATVSGAHCEIERSLVPQPTESAMKCSSRDRSTMRNHVAVAMYVVGTQLDKPPNLLFAPRKVDHRNLNTHAVALAVLGRCTKHKALNEKELGSVGDRTRRRRRAAGGYSSGSGGPAAIDVATSAQGARAGRNRRRSGRERSVRARNKCKVEAWGARKKRGSRQRNLAAKMPFSAAVAAVVKERAGA